MLLRQSAHFVLYFVYKVFYYKDDKYNQIHFKYIGYNHGNVFVWNVLKFFIVPNSASSFIRHSGEQNAKEFLHST